jgi:hypothetical protein
VINYTGYNDTAGEEEGGGWGEGDLDTGYNESFILLLGIMMPLSRD